MYSPWHFGNTTVRNPMRIRNGLRVLYNSRLNGNLNGKSQELLFADELARAEVVDIANRERDYSDIGRKWRACFSQLGFITHKFTRKLEGPAIDPEIMRLLAQESSLHLSGHPYEITPLGKRMIEAETLQEQQECMLRSLLAYEIPSVIENNGEGPSFKPFVFILQVLKQLGELQDNRGLSKEEMAIVQIYRSHDSIDLLIKQIREYRVRREAAPNKREKRRVDKAILSEIAQLAGVKAETLIDYADVNFRYPRLTGLISYQRKRLVLNENKLAVIDTILSVEPQIIGIERKDEYLVRLWNGSTLPTDDEIGAVSEINRLRQLLQNSGIEETQIPYVSDTEDVAYLNMVRMRLEGTYLEILEKDYARVQRLDRQVRETIAYLKKIDKQQFDEEEFDIEIEDEPAYLEWAVWRAFLAINNLANQPYEARRFKVDQDFLPINCAPGGGPDLIFEFDDYVLVVEVTLTTSSRQEAAEGEPVRRHVAKEKSKIAESTGKPVYALFIARNIDNNTAETFRIGVWYNGDTPDFINIVPITVKQFILIMEKFAAQNFDNKEIRTLLDNCLISRNAHAPAWKREIDGVVSRFIS